MSRNIGSVVVPDGSRLLFFAMICPANLHRLEIKDLEIVVFVNAPLCARASSAAKRLFSSCLLFL